MHPASLGFETFEVEQGVVGALKHPNVVAVASVDMSGRLAIHDDVIDASGYIAHYTNVFPEAKYGVDWSLVTHLQYAMPGCGGNPSTSIHSALPLGEGALALAKLANSELSMLELRDD